jgi:cytochrome c
LSATDVGGSGVAKTVYTTDGTDPATSSTAKTYAGPFPIAATTTVGFSSTDIAGNVESTRSQQVLIDGSAPTVNITQPGADAQLKRNSSVAVTATSSDTGTGSGAPSGVAQVAFYLDGTTLLATITSAPYGFTWRVRPNLQGAHTLTAVSTDVAGNSATSPQVRVNITR